MPAAVTDPVAAPAATPAAPAAAPSGITGSLAGAPAGAAATGSAAAPAAAVQPATAAPAAATPAAVRLLSEPEAKPADAKPDATKPADVAAAKPADAPAWELKAPEGSTLSADEVKAAETFAKDAGLTQAQAEKILARDIAGRSAAVEAQKAQAATIADTWLAEAKAHPEIGGAKLDAAVANAKRALGAWATADERKAIAASPFANNPLFLAILNRAAAALPTEDTIHTGTAVAADAGASDPAGAIYPTMRRR